MKLNLRIDPRLKEGYFSDVYLNRNVEILRKDDHHPYVRQQFFQRGNDVCLCGMEESIAFIKDALGDKFEGIKLWTLQDGDVVNAWETVMIIEGDHSLFAHLETPCLGALKRGTTVATNVYRCFKAANGKPILFFPARFDSYLVQAKDGYSYMIGRKASGFEGGGVSTDAQGEWWGSKGIGTMPHSLIADYGGNTVVATLKFAEYIDPDVKRVALVDFDNDCVTTTIAVVEAMLGRYIEGTEDKRYKLYGVRLDTAGNMTDESVVGIRGVCPQLVKNVDMALKRYAKRYPIHSIERSFIEDVGIIPSGGFNEKRIKKFEELNLPTIAYAVGSSLVKGSIDFTADVVQIKIHNVWWDGAKVGRRYNPNVRLRRVE